MIKAKAQVFDFAPVLTVGQLDRDTPKSQHITRRKICAGFLGNVAFLCFKGIPGRLRPQLGNAQARDFGGQGLEILGSDHLKEGLLASHGNGLVKVVGFGVLARLIVQYGKGLALVGRGDGKAMLTCLPGVCALWRGAQVGEKVFDQRPVCPRFALGGEVCGAGVVLKQLKVNAQKVLIVEIVVHVVLSLLNCFPLGGAGGGFG